MAVQAWYKPGTVHHSTDRCYFPIGHITVKRIGSNQPALLQRGRSSWAFYPGSRSPGRSQQALVFDKMSMTLVSPRDGPSQGAERLVKLTGRGRIVLYVNKACPTVASAEAPRMCRRGDYLHLQAASRTRSSLQSAQAWGPERPCSRHGGCIPPPCLPVRIVSRLWPSMVLCSTKVRLKP